MRSGTAANPYRLPRKYVAAAEAVREYQEAKAARVALQVAQAKLTDTPGAAASRVVSARRVRRAEQRLLEVRL